MSAQAQPARIAPPIVEHDPHDPAWSPIARIAFRFSVVYFSLFCLTTQICSGLFFPAWMEDSPDPANLWPVRPTVAWVAAHLFRIEGPLVVAGSGSGDKTSDWILAFCLLVTALLAAAIWSFLDRKRADYTSLQKYFQIFIRFALASQMFVYGMAKVIPMQMPFPYLTRLLEPYGNFSPMGVLWSSIGASPAYETFAGSAEMLGGLLLIFPATSILGALVCLIDMTQVFMLNMTYDVPVKLFSFHLLLMAALLLAPEFPRLFAFLFLNRATGPSAQPRTRRIALVLQLVFGLWLLAGNVYGAWTNWHIYGGGRPRSPLYGIWNVEEMSLDSLATRWRRVVFQFPDSMAFQRMDDSFVRYTASIDTKAKTLTLTKPDDKTHKSTFTYQRLQENAPDMFLDGEIDNQKVHVKLHLFDTGKLLLVSRGFHWIQEFPVNR